MAVALGLDLGLDLGSTFAGAFLRAASLLRYGFRRGLVLVAGLAGRRGPRCLRAVAEVFSLERSSCVRLVSLAASWSVVCSARRFAFLP